MADLHASTDHQAVLFRDGSSISLHRVIKTGAPDTLMRATPVAGGLLAFSLATISRQLAHDVAMSPARDVAGLIFYSLRQSFPSAEAFQAHVMSHRATPVCIDQQMRAAA